ncbi:hypothetical protein Clacol_007021 [Clathrus columnatus]|uniref:C2H2-type domain-containing protein n=1 Tax=Clathrus columnatus TaxID=1419009 RepID=A0AAV5AIL9_9AGAM|nr:hypothetical protein Clacol_007021 [Clathrus columnatus]
MLTSTTSASSPIPIKQRHRSSFSQTRKRRPSESTPRLVHPEDKDKLISSKLQATITPATTTTATFTTTPSGALALSLSPPGLSSGLSKSAPLENEEGISGQSHRRKGTTFRCETCSKVYRHPSCLVKHRWEHSPHWSEASKFLLSKHQQVQLLEAAAILSHLSPATAGGTSLPEDRSLWPSYLSGGLLPFPAGHPNSVPIISAGGVIPGLDCNSTQESSSSFTGVNSVASIGAGVYISAGFAGSHCAFGSPVGMKVEPSTDESIPPSSEDSTSEEENEPGVVVDGDDDDVEFEDEVVVDIDGDTDGEENIPQNGTVANPRFVSGSKPPVDHSAAHARPISLAGTSARARTTTPALSAAPSKSSTPKPLAGSTTIPTRAGLTEIRPGLLGHPNPPSTSYTAGQDLQNGGGSISWAYGYTHPGYVTATTQGPVTTALPSQPGPFSISVPLSVPSFSHTHNTTYSQSPGHFNFTHSYSPAGSITGPFSSLSLSSLSYSNSPPPSIEQRKGLSLPRSSVRSSSGLDDDEEDEKIEDEDDAMDEGDAEPLVNGAANTAHGGEWEMEI